MRRRVLASGLLVSALAVSAMATSPATTALGSPPRSASATDRPNVVVILLDDARSADLSTMPDVVSRIGDRGATFTKFYSSFPLCCPARATLLTGQYPHNHGVLSNHAPLGGFAAFDDRSTLATWLTPTYTTGLVGKYFNEYQAPYKPPGWDEWMVPRAVYNYTFPSWSIDDGGGAQQEKLTGYQTDTIGDLSESFIRRHAGDAQPFFLYTSIVAPHAGGPPEANDPPLPTPRVKEVYRNRFAGIHNTDPSFNEGDVSDKPLHPAPLSAAEISQLTEVDAQRRESELSAQDAAVGILDTLAATGELDNTYVIFTSDNGYILGEHRIRGGKASSYEVASRVPLMVRGPGIAPGTVVDEVTAQVDFAPTVLWMTGNAGANGDSSIDGINLLPFMRLPRTAHTERQAVVLEAGPLDGQGETYRYHGVRGDRWKYVERPQRRAELYDLAADPYELRNVAARAGFRQSPVQVAAEAHMRTLLARYKWCSGPDCR